METAAGTSSVGEEFLEWPSLAGTVGKLFLVASKKTKSQKVGNQYTWSYDLDFNKNDNKIT